MSIKLTKIIASMYGMLNRPKCFTTIVLFVIMNIYFFPLKYLKTLIFRGQTSVKGVIN